MSNTTFRRCSVDGCNEKHVAKGFCQNHYRVFKRMGTATPQKPESKVHTATGGYKFVTVEGKTKYLHVMAAEEALGKPLPPEAEVHHVNGDPSDNRPSNLVVCPNHEYHMLIHQRQRAMDACGNPDYRPCRICGQHDSVNAMRPYRKQFYHAACLAKQSKKQRAKAKQGEES
jgi:hypothetical protein